MNSSLMFPLLQPDQIEVKVKQVSEKGAVALLYKTARTDMDMLDSVAGAMNWRVEYCEIKGNLYCTLYLRDGVTGEWVGKQDCGIESRSDGDGNEKKGEASDAFKRAGFRWGIGRELYTAPFTFLNVPTVKNQHGKFEMKNRFEHFSVHKITYDKNRHINTLEIVDSNGRIVFSTQGRKPYAEEPETINLATRRKRALASLAEQYDISVYNLKGIQDQLARDGFIADKKCDEYTQNEFDDVLIVLEQAIQSKKAAG